MFHSKNISDLWSQFWYFWNISHRLRSPMIGEWFGEDILHDFRRVSQLIIRDLYTYLRIWSLFFMIFLNSKKQVTCALRPRTETSAWYRLAAGRLRLMQGFIIDNRAAHRDTRRSILRVVGACDVFIHQPKVIRRTSQQSETFCSCLRVARQYFFTEIMVFIDISEGIRTVERWN